MSSMLNRLSKTWSSLSLAKQFSLAGSIVLVLGMSAVGTWVSDKIRVGVVQYSAAATALYVESILEPYLQQLATSDRLTPRDAHQLEQLLQSTKLHEQIVVVKVWKRGGVIAYSNVSDLIGRTFPPTDSLKRAWEGVVSSELDELIDDENLKESGLGFPMLEMYIPIRSRGSEEVIAVAEFYSRAEQLMEELAAATRQSILVVAGTTLSMLAALFGIVARGSRTIGQQRRSLEDKVEQLQNLVAQNEQLRQRVERAYRRTSDLNERFLRRVGADLHDGPAQLIGLSLLRLDTLECDKARSEGKRDANLEKIRDALGDALKELRSISSGLTSPALEQADVNQAVRMAIGNHEKRTGTKVATRLEHINMSIPNDVKVCIYRFVQEGLNNSFRHAAAAEARVEVRADARRIRVEVRDNGPGFDETTVNGSGLGLTALRDRVTTLGGSIEVRSREGEGTRLIARFSSHAMEGWDD
ncbi:MAG: sensor histidine kinase [Rhizobiales bacterium]|nr:sensor histidine kinase [Hyphomicrobiales bacterium]